MRGGIRMIDKLFKPLQDKVKLNSKDKQPIDIVDDDFENEVFVHIENYKLPPSLKLRNRQYEEALTAKYKINRKKNAKTL